MATIYRFIVEQKTSGTGTGRKNSGEATNGAAKKGRAVSLFGGNKGGVEHNRKMRAINPLLNKMTHGVYEKAMRVGRAGMGLVQVNSETGAFAGLSWTAIAIIVAFAIQTTLKIQREQINLANQQNTQNFRQLEVGIGAVHGQYKLDTNLWNGRITYNQNK